MAFTAFRTWVASEVITAALLNAQVRDNGLILKTSIADDGTLAGLLFGRVTSDVSATSTTTLADVTGLSFPIGVSEEWTFVCFVHIEGNTSADARFGVTVPSGAAGRYGLPIASGAGVEDATIGTDIFQSLVTGADILAIIAGTVVNSTTGGTVQLQMAQGSSNGDPTVVYANSSIIAVKIA